MRIAIDISPFESGHKVRGSGFYLLHLKHALTTYFPEHDYFFFTQHQRFPRNIQVIHYPYFEPYFLTLPLLKKKKTVVTVHDLTPLVFPKHFPAGFKGLVKWRVQKLALQRSDAVITDSKSSKKDINKIANIKSSKIHIIPLAAGEEFAVIDDKEVKKVEMKKKYHLPEKFVLYVGDVTWNKNLPRLLTAIKKTNIPLVMVGKALANTNFDESNPWNADLIKVQTLSYNDKRILKLGFVPTEDLVTLYNIATVSVTPSLYEGFGLPVLEAMSCGCPVITTKESSLSEVAGDAAYYVDGYNENSIAEGIKHVFLNEKLQKELSERGLQQAKKFSWEKTAEETIKIYKSLV